MLSWTDAHRTALIRVQQLHGDLGTPMDRPVDVFAAIEQAGPVLGFAPLGNHVDGVYLPQRVGRSAGVLIHQFQPRTRQRYTAGHELGHWAFGHTNPLADGNLEVALQRGEADRWPDHEKQAEAFGAWFLMPRRLVRHALSELGFEVPRDPFDVYSLSLWLGTSYTATARHLPNLRLVDRAQADAWARIAPAALKRALAQELVPDNLRNDVWWLDERHHGRHIIGRPGDRIVLTLEEIPSSGITWQVEELPSGVVQLADSFVDPFEPERFTGSLDPTDEVAGDAFPRAFVFEIRPEAGELDGQLRLTERAPHEPDGPVEGTLDVAISVHPSHYGLVLEEEELALPA